MAGFVPPGTGIMNDDDHVGPIRSFFYEFQWQPNRYIFWMIFLSQVTPENCLVLPCYTNFSKAVQHIPNKDNVFENHVDRKLKVT